MFSFPNMLDLFAHEFTGLGGWGFAFGCVFARPLQSFLFWHLLNPLVVTANALNLTQLRYHRRLYQMVTFSTRLPRFCRF